MDTGLQQKHKETQRSHPPPSSKGVIQFEWGRSHPVWVRKQKTTQWGVLFLLDMINIIQSGIESSADRLLDQFDLKSEKKKKGRKPSAFSSGSDSPLVSISQNQTKLDKSRVSGLKRKKKQKRTEHSDDSQPEIPEKNEASASIDMMRLEIQLKNRVILLYEKIRQSYLGIFEEFMLHFAKTAFIPGDHRQILE